ncbi:MAG TPA: antibiotic biosynthesis monooxygenase [Candidatus Tectomicrobia bacterium]|nr:antibiotic biosynthesis monooxygenase [Candidatus Tectomicrobia bacterium]
MAEPQAARADEASDRAVYVVSYVEVMPSATAETIALLRQYRQASRREAGQVGLEVLQQRSRPDHFAILEAWRDQQAFDAHAMAAHTRQCHEQLGALRVSPVDERLHSGLAIGSLPASYAAGAMFVLTHADAIPPAKDEATTALQQLAEASRKQEGNRHFEVLQQRSRQNHFTIVEIWQDQKAFEAHTMAAHTRQFREAFQPMTGSLYDERLYQALD